MAYTIGAGRTETPLKMSGPDISVANRHREVGDVPVPNGRSTVLYRMDVGLFLRAASLRSRHCGAATGLFIAALATQCAIFRQATDG